VISTIPATPVLARDTEPVAADEVAGVIDIEDLEDDRRDPEWQAFLKAALCYRSELRLEGRIK
jgi:hypothetical protein